MKKSLKIFIPFLLIAALLAGCGGSSKKSAAGTYGYTAAAPARTVNADRSAVDGSGYGIYFAEEAEADYSPMEAPASAEKAKETGSGSGDQLPTGRKIIRNADLSVETREYDMFMGELSGRIGASGGYIESSYSSGSSYSSRRNMRSVTMTVRVPAANLDTFLDGVCAQGNVLYKNVYTNDVTATYVDTEARLNALRTERDTLMQLLEKAEKMEDIIVIYQRISDVTYEIESYESRIRTYDDQIAYSTVSLTVQEVERETQVVEETFWQETVRRLGENLEDIGESFKGFFIGLVAALPGLIIVALFALVICFIVRKIVRKSKKKEAAKPAETKKENK